LPDFKRPWQNPVPPLNGVVEKNVLYPADEEDHGLVYISYRGPNAKVWYNSITNGFPGQLRGLFYC